MNSLIGEGRSARRHHHRGQDNSGWTSREAADAIAEQTGADVVQVIGSKFVLFKRNPKEPVIENIPKANK